MDKKKFSQINAGTQEMDVNNPEKRVELTKKELSIDSQSFINVSREIANDPKNAELAAAINQEIMESEKIREEIFEELERLKAAA